MVIVKRRAIGVTAILAMSAWLILGLVPAASAATVTGTTGVLTTSADDSNIGAGATITGYTGSTAGVGVVIPNSVVIAGNSYAVTSIGVSAFDTKHITSVSIPASVTTIGNDAFYANSLTAVTLPAGLTTLGTGAFTLNLLTTVTIPAPITAIPFASFDGNDLTSVTFAGVVTSIGASAFANNLFTSFTIPDTVTSIGTNAFIQNPGLTSLLIPASVTSLGDTIVDSTIADVEFRGPVPTTFTAAGSTGSLGTGANLTVSYPWRFGDPQTSGGYTSPTWQGYNTVQIVRVSFTMDGHGAAVADSEFSSGSAPTQPANPTASGRTFLGWFTDADLTTKFDFATTQTTDQVAFAGWSGLAETGVSISPFALPAAGGVLVLGSLLIVISRRRRVS